MNVTGLAGHIPLTPAALQALRTTVPAAGP